MTAQKGKDLLLKVAADAGGGFVTVAGLRARSIAFNAETVDVTDQDSAGQWRELLVGAGVRGARVAGAGVFRDAASDALIRETFFAGTVRDWQIVVPDFGTVSGPFEITSFEWSGRHDGEVAFELTVESAGALTFAVM